jgi:hypothetical protein
LAWGFLINFCYNFCHLLCRGILQNMHLLLGKCPYFHKALREGNAKCQLVPHDFFWLFKNGNNQKWPRAPTLGDVQKYERLTQGEGLILDASKCHWEGALFWHTDIPFPAAGCQCPNSIRNFKILSFFSTHRHISVIHSVGKFFKDGEFPQKRCRFKNLYFSKYLNFKQGEFNTIERLRLHTLI